MNHSHLLILAKGQAGDQAFVVVDRVEVEADGILQAKLPQHAKWVCHRLSGLCSPLEAEPTQKKEWHNRYVSSWNENKQIWT